MKHNYLFYFLITLFITFNACKKDDGGIKVGVAEGKIVLKSGNEKDFYTITNIYTKIIGDTTTIVVEGLKTDSSLSIFIGFQKVGGFGENTYPITGEFKNDTSQTLVYAYLNSEWESGKATIPFKDGTIEVLQYMPNDNLQCKFSFSAPQIDTSETLTITGEMFASYALLDPNRVPNLSITPGTAVANVNQMPTYFKTSYAGYTQMLGMRKYIITSTSSVNQTITISLIDFTPRINKNYEVGKNIIETPDSAGLIEVNYFENGINYVANEDAGSGIITITKITGSTLQGKFNVVTANKNDTTKKVVFENGLFYAKLKDYSVK